MKEGLTEPATERRASEATRFRQADPRSDGKMAVAEFLCWSKVGRFSDARRKDGRRAEEARAEDRRDDQERRNPNQERRHDGDRDAEERESSREQSESDRKLK